MPKFVDNGQYCCLCLRRINELQGPSAAFLEPAAVALLLPQSDEISSFDDVSWFFGGIPAVDYIELHLAEFI